MANAYDKFAWKEVSTGVWEREIDEVEQYYHHLVRIYEGSGRMFFAITGHVILTVPLLDGNTVEKASEHIESALRYAWLRLRYDCPTIASQVVYDKSAGKLKKRYQTFTTDKTQQDWLEKTFRPVNTGQMGVEWANSDPPAPDLATLFVLAPSSGKDNLVRRDLILRAPHDIIDGIGTLHLFNKLISSAANVYNSVAPPIDFGKEMQNLSPPLRVAAGIRPSLSVLQKAKLPVLAARNVAVKAGIDIASIPFKQGPLMPGKHQRTAFRLTEADTKAVLGACKKIGVTVTHAFHAAIALAIQDRQERKGKERKMRYINYILINERKRCQGPYGTANHAAAVYHSVPSKSLYVDLKVPATHQVVGLSEKKRQFDCIVADVRDFYLSACDEDHIHFVPAIWSFARKPWSPSEDGTPPPVPEPNRSPSVSISSLGMIERIIEPEHGEFRVHSPWVVGEELGTGLGLFLGTFRGQLELSGTYNAAWHDEQEVKAFLDDCWRVVREGLEL